MNNRIHHEIVEIQKANRRIRKFSFMYHNTPDLKEWQRKKNKRAHLFRVHPEYKKVWKAAKLK